MKYEDGPRREYRFMRCRIARGKKEEEKEKIQDLFSFAKPVVNLTPDEEDGREVGNVSGAGARMLE